jgi:membrane protein required for colicin V production
MNSFDAAVTAVAIFAAAMGFMSGLLRSLTAIFAYLIAAPIAIALTPRVTGLIFGPSPGPDQASIVLCVVFIAFGLLLSALSRSFVDGLVGDDIGLLDRTAGAALGILRIFLVAVLLVVVFDRLIPADRTPAFLVGSKLRPYLSAVGQQGLQTLPPDVQTYVDRIKREHGL